MAGDSRRTTNHNIDVLINNGFRKHGNSTIFSKMDCMILSPAVSAGSTGKYWFDLRQVNLEKVSSAQCSLILLRIVPDMFVLVELSEFSQMLTERTKRERKNSGEVWGFYIDLNMYRQVATIISSADSSLTHSEKIYDKSSIVEVLVERVS